MEGCHPVAILKITENFKSLSDGLQNIIQEARNLTVIEVDGINFEIILFIGGDWKFLAMIYGLESAISNYPCIWCKCPKSQRWDMSQEWSLLDTKKGARTVDEIAEKSKLSKHNTTRFNCVHEPLFPFIPLKRVVIDTLHLFLRICDVLINLLIRDLRLLDNINHKDTNIKKI